MSLDRFAATYTPPKKQTVKRPTKEELHKIQKETKKKDMEFERQQFCDEFIRINELIRKMVMPTLNFPLVAWGDAMRYDIPADQKRDVINSMDCMKRDVPLYDGIYTDIHSDKVVRGSELEVIRENDKNYVVSPHYNESGGTLIDLMPVKEPVCTA